MNLSFSGLLASRFEDEMRPIGLITRCGPGESDSGFLGIVRGKRGWVLGARLAEVGFDVGVEVLQGLAEGLVVALDSAY